MDMKVTIPTPYGDIELTYLQVMTMHACIETLQAEGKKAIWHKAQCDCCIVVHEAGAEACDEGFVIGQDGGYDLVVDGQIVARRDMPGKEVNNEES